MGEQHTTARGDRAIPQGERSSGCLRFPPPSHIPGLLSEKRHETDFWGGSSAPRVRLPRAAGWDAGAGWVQRVLLRRGPAARTRFRCRNESAAGALGAARPSPLPPGGAAAMPLAPFGAVSAPPATLPVSLATRSHKHQAAGAERDRPNTQPGNWAINIYTPLLGFAHPAAPGARPAAEVQVLTVPLVVVQDFQPDHNPCRLGVLGQIHSRGGQRMLLVPSRGARASRSSFWCTCSIRFAHRCLDERSCAAPAAPGCCEHNCSDAIWARLPHPQPGSHPYGDKIQSCEHCWGPALAMESPIKCPSSQDDPFFPGIFLLNPYTLVTSATGLLSALSSEHRFQLKQQVADGSWVWARNCAKWHRGRTIAFSPSRHLTQS